jgi:hypothetical protein
MHLPGDDPNDNSLKTNDSSRTIIAGDDLAATLDAADNKDGISSGQPPDSATATSLVAPPTASDLPVTSTPSNSLSSRSQGTPSELGATVDDGPWGDPLSEGAQSIMQERPAGDVSPAVDTSGTSATSSSSLPTSRDDGSVPVVAPGQAPDTLRNAITDVMKHGISESGEVGETAVTLVDNLDNWEKFYSSDSTTQISGAVGIVKDFNSQFVLRVTRMPQAELVSPANEGRRADGRNTGLVTGVTLAEGSQLGLIVALLRRREQPSKGDPRTPRSRA